MCFIWISKQTAVISLYGINWLVFVTQTKRVSYAVRIESLIHVTFRLYSVKNEQQTNIDCHTLN
jgi:hypothetical protein